MSCQINFYVLCQPRPQLMFPHTPPPALPTNSHALKMFLSRPPPPIPRPLVLSTNQTPRADVMYGRTPRIEPSSNEGNFVKAAPILPALGSFSVNPSLSRGPVVNNNRRVVTGKKSRIPKLSPNHKLTVYIASQFIQGLPKHREDLTLLLLEELIEFE